MLAPTSSSAESFPLHCPGPDRRRLARSSLDGRSPDNYRWVIDQGKRFQPNQEPGANQKKFEPVRAKRDSQEKLRPHNQTIPDLAAHIKKGRLNFLSPAMNSMQRSDTLDRYWGLRPVAGQNLSEPKSREPMRNRVRSSGELH